MGAILPYTGRVTVADPPGADDLQSGLIIIGQTDLSAGIVTDVADDVTHLRPGYKVYYGKDGCITIGSTKIVHAHYVVAYEEA